MDLPTHKYQLQEVQDQLSNTQIQIYIFVKKKDIQSTYKKDDIEQYHYKTHRFHSTTHSTVTHFFNNNVS